MMSLDKVKDIMKIAKEPISIETPIGDEDDTMLKDFIRGQVKSLTAGTRYAGRVENSR